MKRRITALILVVVMLALALVSCGYSFTKDDMSQYANFDKDRFNAAIQAILIEDGEYTKDNADTRKIKIKDYIYEILLANVDTNAKVTTGTVGARDKFFYCYYVTALCDDGVTRAFLTSNMKEASALNLQFGNSSTDGYQKKIEDAFTGVALDGIIYDTDTSSATKAKAGDIAFISYTITEANKTNPENGNVEEGKTYTVTNERVTVGDANHPIAKDLADKAVATSLTDVTVGEGEAQVKYTSIKIDWIVTKGTEKTFTDVTYTEEKKLKSANDGKEYDLKDKELTYHVFPVYFLAVEEYKAETIIKTLISELIHDEDDGHNHEEESIYALPSFESAVDEVKDVIAKDEALNGNGLKEGDEGYIKGAIAEYAAAESAKTTAQTALTNAENAIKAKEEKNEQPTQTELEAKSSAQTALTEAETKLAAAKTAKEAAEAAYTAAIDTLFTKIGANNSGDINTGKAKVIEEYEADIHDILVAEYNEEIKKNLATELWSLIQSSTKDLTVDNLPGEAVENAYDRIYSRYQYLFYNGKYDDGDSSTTDTDSNYSKYYGIFEDYLMVETSTKTVADAEAEVLKQAKEHVLISVTVFAAAEALNLELTKDEIKDLNRPGNDYLVEYYGEDNVQTAAQFDKILNHLLEIEEEPDANDVDVYKNIKWAPKTEE